MVVKEGGGRKLKLREKLVSSYLQYMQKPSLQELKQTPALYLIDKTQKG